MVPPSGFLLDPSLTVAILGILDVPARVQQCPAVKTPIDISAMRSVASVVYYPKQAVCFSDAGATPQPAASFLPLMSCFRFILLQFGDPLV